MDPISALLSTGGGALALDASATSGGNPFNSVDFGGGVTINRGFSTGQLAVVGVIGLIGIFIWRRFR